MRPALGIYKDGVFSQTNTYSSFDVTPGVWPPVRVNPPYRPDELERDKGVIVGVYDLDTGGAITAGNVQWRYESEQTGDDYTTEDPEQENSSEVPKRILREILLPSGREQWWQKRLPNGHLYHLTYVAHDWPILSPAYGSTYSGGLQIITLRATVDGVPANGAARIVVGVTPEELNEWEYLYVPLVADITPEEPPGNFWTDFIFSYERV